MTIRNYSWLRDLPDHRDFKFSATFGITNNTIPDSVDLRKFCSKIENQGDLGSCSAQATAGALEYLENKNGDSFIDLSRLFIYYNTRVIQGTTSYDSGASIRNAVKSVVQYGACSESEWKYQTWRFHDTPTPNCYKDASKHKAQQYIRLSTSTDIKNCLAAGYPIIFGAAIYNSFESNYTERTGIVTYPASGEKQLGGHAMLIVGYDNTIMRYIVRNSWGADWGDEGYCYFPYQYIEEPNLCSDFWTIRKADGI